jgi:hypothetical protein
VSIKKIVQMLRPLRTATIILATSRSPPHRASPTTPRPSSTTSLTVVTKPIQLRTGHDKDRKFGPSEARNRLVAACIWPSKSEVRTMAQGVPRTVVLSQLR